MPKVDSLAACLLRSSVINRTVCPESRTEEMCKDVLGGAEAAVCGMYCVVLRCEVLCCCDVLCVCVCVVM